MVTDVLPCPLSLQTNTSHFNSLFLQGFGSRFRIWIQHLITLRHDHECSSLPTIPTNKHESFQLTIPTRIWSRFKIWIRHMITLRHGYKCFSSSTIPTNQRDSFQLIIPIRIQIRIQNLNSAPDNPTTWSRMFLLVHYPHKPIWVIPAHYTHKDSDQDSEFEFGTW